MEVTKSNFKELFPEIVKAIDESSFVAIDGEFTGLNNGPDVSAFDTPAEYYAKIHSGSLDFLFIQCGLSIFKQIKGHERYKNKTYVFYLFPEPLNRVAPDCRFLCQSSSLNFLAQNGFDFNKVFKEGIPYLKQKDEESLREAMAEKAKMRAQINSNSIDSPIIPIPINCQKYVDAAMDKIKELLSPDFEKDEVHVEKCSGFVRKLVYQTFRQELKDSNITVETKNGVLIARRNMTEEKIEQERKEKEEKDEESIQNAVGFTSVIKHLASSKKLIVGHNLLLDMCHILHRFVDKLPESYLEFKEMLHSVFPNVVDTKYFVWESLKDEVTVSHLSGIVDALSKPPFKVPEIESEEGLSFNIDDQKLHNAGYDAYVTGLAFLSSLRYLDSSSDPPLKTQVLQKHLNKMFLMRTPDTFVNLSGKDPVPRRDHVFHVTFPKVWTSQNLIELFSPYGSININWLNDTSAWVALHDRDSANKVKNGLEDKGVTKCPGVVVRGYARFMAKATIAAASPRPNKRKSNEPVKNKRTYVPDVDSSNGANKKRKSSSINRPSVETIYEENENATDAIKDLEKCESSGDFAVDNNWE